MVRGERGKQGFSHHCSWCKLKSLLIKRSEHSRFACQGMPSIMNLSLKKLAASTLILASLSSFASLANATVTAQQSAVILKTFSDTSVKDFRQFLNSLANADVVKTADFGPAISAFLDNKPLSAAQQNDIHRLLGLYTRMKYGSAATETLRELVAIPTVRVDGVAQHENPAFIKIADKIKSLAEGFDLKFRNVDNRVYEVSLDGASDEVVGIHVHADVVPVTLDNWVLPDGTRLDPFKVTLIGDRMYGRGTEDDKNGIVVALYAMKVIKEEKLPLARNFKLLIDTTEETAGDAIPYYFERNPTPAYNLALDGGYPVVIAEKGYGTVMASFARRQAEGEGAEIVSMTGGMATNQIPSKSVATLLTDKPAELAASLQQAGAEYVKSNGGDFEVDARVDGKDVKLTVTGVSAHSSAPQSGVNPVARMLDFINSLQGKVALKHNQITDAARYAADNWGLDYLGSKLGVGFSDDFMGPLTASLTYVAMDEKAFKLAVNLRVPKGKSPQVLKSEIAEKLAAWSTKTAIKPAFDYSIAEPMYRNPEGEWVKALLAVASENLGMEHTFGTSAGATSVHSLPNGVQFGLARPEVKYTGHTDNEFKTTGQFLLDLQIVTEMMGRIGQLPKL
ncbi:Acetylornithine deacetylase/Succinyl-diaminopimelate desuccinylase and related deacylase [Pseudomonas syringae pv. solidagae]|uniref:Peptidase M20A, peptidase V n=4 Tax=Pseudomonas TaxID=286 RepID=A0A0P9Z5W8_PSESX|nr:Acetylornithine deacetylase/Succinyl-diaminopimelate desuccinylase and related deacylase [Pseudomonas syringae pv. solidagae]RMT39682.1 Peptidase M20A, peptidase V [Pseudomonas syringae pv. solidagae]RMT41393.1 Acetylornithine deacetylase/Succinyl-diaminopimelate desuccinylase and related deacylase [Pseudomonas syringae pv. solidagae]